MKKKDILKKIEEQVARGILKPSGDPVGLKITKQALKKSKEENDSYYKELEKKFKDYLKLDVKDNPSPKVNMTDEERKMYYGTGMEGLKYDDEGTPKHEKFVKRNEELNKPSKNYYLNNDQVEDSYDKIMKDGKAYKKHKYEKPDEYQKTPKVRITKESEDKKTMKQLSYKKPFVSYEKTVTLIPENYKTDGNKFRMTDGNEFYTIRWEGDSKSGSPTLLTYKNESLVKEDVSKMKHLYDYKSEETLMKTNDALTENQIFMELMGKTRTLVNEQTTPPPTQTTAAKTPVTGGQKQVTQKTIKTGSADEKPKEIMIDGIGYTLPGIKDKAALDKFTNTGINLTNPNDMVRVLGSGLNINYNEKNNLATRTVLSLKEVLDAHARKGITKPHTTFENLSNFVKGTLKSSLLENLGLDDTKKQNYMKYYIALLDSRLKGLSQN
jgi:hypothetical protein